MYSVKVQTAQFDKAMARLIRELGKDVQEETLRQAKLLALQVASNAPPKVRGMKGLAAGIPRAKAKSWLKVVKRLVKPAYGMRVLDAVRMGSANILKGIAETKIKLPFREYKSTNPYKQSAANRILAYAKKDAAKSLEIFRTLFKGHLSKGSNQAPVVYQDMNTQAFSHYFQLLDKMGKGGLKSIGDSQRIYLTQSIKAERQKIIAAYIPTIGTVKAGWVQAAMQIPSKAGRKPPNWLLNKKSIGQGSFVGQGLKCRVTMRNAKGNAKGMDDRTQYVARAMRFRVRKMLNAVTGAISRQLANKYRQMGQPVPAHLKFASRSSRDEEIE